MYNWILKPILVNEIELCRTSSITRIIREFQPKVLKATVNAVCFINNPAILQNLEVPCVKAKYAEWGVRW